MSLAARLAIGEPGHMNVDEALPLRRRSGASGIEMDGKAVSLGVTLDPEDRMSDETQVEALVGKFGQRRNRAETACRR